MRKIWEKLVLIYKVLEDKQLLHFAASLSFHTLLSIIPVLFISLSIFTQLPSLSGYSAKIKNFIFSNFTPKSKA